MIALKRFAAGAALVGALGLSALGGGVGVAYADPGHGHGHGHDDDWQGDDWGHWNGPRYWDPVQACITAGGPFGYVQGSVCI